MPEAEDGENLTSPEQLGDIFEAWRDNDITNRGMLVSFTQLLMEDDYDLRHDAWVEGYRAEVEPRREVPTMGTSQANVDVEAMVAAFVNGQDAAFTVPDY